jgi:hypothetical protein
VPIAFLAAVGGRYWFLPRGEMLMMNASFLERKGDSEFQAET